ncbi:MAG: sigma-70 family RNA polymerase sigma factor [Barnesiella sp.]|nr:sigma-70 family RNA polymerase sigma factor [Barnesiella sp.]
MKEELLTSVFMRIRGRLQSAARRLVDDEAVNDALQDAFVRLWNRRSDLDTESAVEGMAVTTVRNICIDTLRRDAVRRHDDIADNEKATAVTDDADDSRERGELYGEVSRLIDTSLSERDRRILYLRDRDGWEMEDIAEEMGISETNVRVILSRARKTIRQIYRNRKTLI